MPLPIRSEKEEKLAPISYGVSATCDCGECKKCKNRARQKRYYDKNRTDILTGDFFQRLDEEGEK